MRLLVIINKQWEFISYYQKGKEPSPTSPLVTKSHPLQQTDLQEQPNYDSMLQTGLSFVPASFKSFFNRLYNQKVLQTISKQNTAFKGTIGQSDFWNTGTCLMFWSGY